MSNSPIPIFERDTMHLEAHSDQGWFSPPVMMETLPEGLIEDQL